MISNYVIEVTCGSKACEGIDAFHITDETRLVLENVTPAAGQEMSLSVRAENKEDGFLGEPARLEVDLDLTSPLPKVLVKTDRGFSVVDTDLNSTLLRLPFTQQAGIFFRHFIGLDYLPLAGNLS